MNLFRFCGDLMHLASICILMLKMMSSNSVSGISFKSQLLYAIVFITRYLDLFVHFISLYNTLMKLFFIGSALYVLYLMRVKLQATYDSSQDTFRIEILLVTAGVLALIFHEEFTVLEVLWTFSIYLEAVAILPQLYQLSKTGEAETITTHYLFALGGYRGLYLLNWIYRYHYEGYVSPIAWIAGTVQTLLYLDFFYVYFTKVLQGKKFQVEV